VRRLRVHFSADAADRLATLNPRRQGMLRQEIVWVAGRIDRAESGSRDRLLQVRTPTDIAACEVLEDRGLVLVYAVVPRRELLRMLWGPEVERKVRQRAASRLEHGRWWTS
jgi:hypothetical protein